MTRLRICGDFSPVFAEKSPQITREPSATRRLGHARRLEPTGSGPAPALAAISMIGVGFPQYLRETAADDAAGPPSSSGFGTAGTPVALGNSRAAGAAGTAKDCWFLWGGSDSQDSWDKCDAHGA
jgi:hypothetical protein